MAEYHLDCSFARELRDKLDDFTFGYLETAMWTLTDSDGHSLDYLGLHDIAEETIAKAIEICADFQRANAEMINGRNSRAGHDFWLTRNHHGAGFWDGDWPEHGETLTANAHAYGSVDWYVGDDGYVYEM